MPEKVKETQLKMNMELEQITSKVHTVVAANLRDSDLMLTDSG